MGPRRGGGDVPAIPDESELAALVEESPAEVLAAYSLLLEDDEDPEAALELAGEFALRGVNVFRLLKEHPETARGLFGTTDVYDETLIEEMEFIIEQRG